ncbi:DUF2490 domain-containing protein [Pontibacter sp. JH31]|uniref:DUF2490 domain-containing protein n=1 Tax=Pontibacter aquaedesilientis TaxID=2766980 RepID=A0ABR7XGB5_9BACT|nr:DUF2490 domain-containing protein [Pontibacter aquaedesilientis]MBD1396976.1 DUF2490 domain-containing protein [Pontibacter aquaedesilientis]
MNTKHILCKLAVGLSLALLTQTIQAQSSRIKDFNNNGWYMYFGDHKLHSKWGLHTELQWRRHNLIKDPQQLLIRTGINYDLTPAAMFTLGYGFIETHPYGDFPAAGTFPEHRIYEQLQLKSNLDRVGLMHRYRLEQRWIKPADADSYTYLNRARYMIKATLPLVGPTLEAKEPFLAVYDEVFVGFGNNIQRNIFDQNRAYAALGYKFSNAATLELGYLNQIVQKANGVVFEHNHTLQVSLFYHLNFTE